MSIKEIDDSYQQTSLFDISDFKAEEAKTAIKQPKKAMNDVPQSSLFSFAYPSFKFAKPVRLIELFAGYGSQMMAMERLREEGFFPLGFETWRICEWAIPSFIAWAMIHAKNDHNDYSASFDKDALVKILSERGSSLDWKAPAGTEKLKRKPEEYLRMAYNAMVASRNVVDITRAKASDFAMENRDKYDVVLTWSFPCQSLSLAGKRAGMDEGSGSESSLGYEVLRLLDEMKEIGQLPTVLVMENVPQFASSSNHENIMKIQDRLGKLGYKSYVKVQSATDFGVPQTRKRCFMISVLGDYSYSFPTGFPLALKLKDKLEENVEGKYYLSRKVIKGLLTHLSRNKANGNGFGFQPLTDNSISHTLPTASNKSDSAYLISYGKTVNKEEVSFTFKSTIPKCAIDADGRIDLSAVYVTDEANPRFLVWDGKEWRELRIRRLTPRECFRLQDVSDADFDLIKDCFAESILYHLAGDSICVANIYFDFKEMCVRQEKLALKIPRGVVKDGNHD